MKKLLYSLLAAVMVLGPFICTPLQTAAQEVPANVRNFIPATGITDVPAKTWIGASRVLTGTVIPDDATNKTIEWSVKDAGATGAVIEEGGILSAKAKGNAVVTATIADGTAGSLVASMAATGASHTVALKADGTLWAWGLNDSGQLGVSPEKMERSNIPIQVGSANDWKAAAAGGYHTVALKEDGTLWAWGWNDYGQLGFANSEENGCTNIEEYLCCTAPVQIGTDTDWKSVAAGYEHTVALKTDGSLWAWGDNYYSQIGTVDEVNGCDTYFDDDSKSNRWFCPTPVRIGLDNNWKEVSAGYAHNMALKTDGSLWAWGWNYLGRLGVDPEKEEQNCGYGEIYDVMYSYCYNPVQVGLDKDWKTVAAAGGSHTTALKTNGSLWVWGDNRYGQLGISMNHDICNDNDPEQYFCSAPVQVGTDTNWASVAVGDAHTVALKTDGSLWAWGSNDYYQLGIDPEKEAYNCIYTEDKDVWYCPVPILVDSAGGWSLVPLNNGNHIVAFKTDGSLWTWGLNDYGQLGDGTDEDSYTAVQVMLPMHFTRDFTIRVIVCGDVDRDGIVSLADALWQARSLAGWDFSDMNVDFDEDAADADDDGEITLRDLLVLLRHLAVWDGYETLPWVEWKASPDEIVFDDKPDVPSIPTEKEVAVVSVVPAASVKKLNGNKNDLIVDVTETFSDGSTNKITRTVSINNNAAGSYEVGSYAVYVDTKGSDQIRQCYIVK